LFISPESRTVQLYRLQEDATKPVLIRGGHDTLESSLFPGLVIDLEKVFAA
jgi:hypothetical protein